MKKIGLIQGRRTAKTKTGRLLGFVFLIVLHLIVLTGLFLEPPFSDFAVLLASYIIVGMYGVNAGLHRYFSHRAFKTSRFMQFIFALLGSLSLTDAISFAGKHRIHHRHTDKVRDVHGPQFGFWQSWFGSLVDHGYTRSELQAQVKDLVCYPELMFLHRLSFLPALLTAVLIYLLGGFTMMAVGYLGSLVVFIHLAGATNYFCHKFGYRWYDTNDTATNNFWVNMITMGEGWHHNHHYYQTSAKLGFFWWEWDPTYRSIQMLALLGLVWEVKTVPDHLRIATIKAQGKIHAGA